MTLHTQERVTITPTTCCAPENAADRRASGRAVSSPPGMAKVKESTYGSQLPLKLLKKTGS